MEEKTLAEKIVAKASENMGTDVGWGGAYGSNKRLQVVTTDVEGPDGVYYITVDEIDAAMKQIVLDQGTNVRIDIRQAICAGRINNDETYIDDEALSVIIQVAVFGDVIYG